MDQNVKKYKFYCLDAQHCILFVVYSPYVVEVARKLDEAFGNLGPALSSHETGISNRKKKD